MVPAAQACRRHSQLPRSLPQQQHLLLRLTHLVGHCRRRHLPAVAAALAGLPLQRGRRRWQLAVDAAAEGVWPLQHCAACVVYRPKAHHRCQPVGGVDKLGGAAELAPWRRSVQQACGGRFGAGCRVLRGGCTATLACTCLCRLPACLANPTAPHPRTPQVVGGEVDLHTPAVGKVNNAVAARRGLAGWGEEGEGERGQRWAAAAPPGGARGPVASGRGTAPAPRPP